VREIWEMTNLGVVEDLGYIGNKCCRTKPKKEKKHKKKTQKKLVLSVEALACCKWRAAARGLKPLRLPRAREMLLSQDRCGLKEQVSHDSQGHMSHDSHLLRQWLSNSPLHLLPRPFRRQHLSIEEQKRLLLQHLLHHLSHHHP